jgi:hypothetical protein
MQAPLQDNGQTGDRPTGRTLYRPGQSGNPLGKGLTLHRAREDEAARQAEVAAILADFGTTTHAQRLLIDELAAQVIRARRLRSFGKAAEAADATRLVSRLATQLGLRRDAGRGRRRDALRSNLVRMLRGGVEP